MRSPSLQSANIERRYPHPTGVQKNAEPAARRYGSLFAAARKTIPGVSSLQREMVEIQRRLGTALERPGDLIRVREVAHKLNNVLCVALLRAQLIRLDRIDYGAAAAA